jgi:hypothetical protein
MFNVTNVMAYYIRMLNHLHGLFPVDTSHYEKKLLVKLDLLVPDCSFELVNKDSNPQFKVALRDNPQAFALIDDKRTDQSAFEANGYMSMPEQFRDIPVPITGKPIATNYPHNFLPN